MPFFNNRETHSDDSFSEGEFGEVQLFLASLKHSPPGDNPSEETIAAHLDLLSLKTTLKLLYLTKNQRALSSHLTKAFLAKQYVMRLLKQADILAEDCALGEGVTFLLKGMLEEEEDDQQISLSEKIACLTLACQHENQAAALIATKFAMDISLSKNLNPSEKQVQLSTCRPLFDIIRRQFGFLGILLEKAFFEDCLFCCREPDAREALIVSIVKNILLLERISLPNNIIEISCAYAARSTGKLLPLALPSSLTAAEIRQRHLGAFYRYYHISLEAQRHYETQAKRLLLSDPQCPQPSATNDAQGAIRQALRQQQANAQCRPTAARGLR